jgi:hypothetical protein
MSSLRWSDLQRHTQRHRVWLLATPRGHQGSAAGPWLAAQALPSSPEGSRAHARGRLEPWADGSTAAGDDGAFERAALLKCAGMLLQVLPLGQPAGQLALPSLSLAAIAAQLTRGPASWVQAPHLRGSRHRRLRAGNRERHGRPLFGLQAARALLSPEDGPEQAAGSRSGEWPHGLPRAGTLWPCRLTRVRTERALRPAAMKRSSSLVSELATILAILRSKTPVCTWSMNSSASSRNWSTSSEIPVACTFLLGLLPPFRRSLLGGVLGGGSCCMRTVRGAAAGQEGPRL